MHVCIHSIHRNPAPADLQGNWVSIARSVIFVLIQPVPSVSHEVGVKAYDDLPIGCLLLSDPVKHCVESTFTVTCTKRSVVFYQSVIWVKGTELVYLWVCVSIYPQDGAVTMYHRGAVWLSCPSSPSQSQIRWANSWAA